MLPLAFDAPLPRLATDQDCRELEKLIPLRDEFTDFTLGKSVFVFSKLSSEPPIFCFLLGGSIFFSDPSSGPPPRKRNTGFFALLLSLLAACILGNSMNSGIREDSDAWVLKLFVGTESVVICDKSDTFDKRLFIGEELILLTSTVLASGICIEPSTSAGGLLIM